jgi:hypothetical protein
LRATLSTITDAGLPPVDRPSWGGPGAEVIASLDAARRRLDLPA